MKGIVTLCALVAVLAGCNKPVEEVPIVQILPQTNSEYIKMVAEISGDAIIINGKYKLAAYISERLSEVEHINPEPYKGSAAIMDTPTAEELMRFDEENLIKVYYLLQSFYDSSFRQKIGKELELDRNDTSCEHGGVLYLLENGDVEVKMLSHDPLKCSMDFTSKIGSLADYRYCPPDINVTVGELTVFHLHSHKEYNIQSTALSPGDGGLVFSRVGEGRFNVDIALLNKAQIIHLDLGVYNY